MYCCCRRLFVCFLIGSAVLVITTTEVDKTGASYYGEQGLHYLSAKGEGNIVLLGKVWSHLLLKGISTQCFYIYLWSCR